MTQPLLKPLLLSLGVHILFVIWVIQGFPFFGLFSRNLSATNQGEITYSVDISRLFDSDLGLEIRALKEFPKHNLEEASSLPEREEAQSETKSPIPRRASENMIPSGNLNSQPQNSKEESSQPSSSFQTQQGGTSQPLKARYAKALLIHLSQFRKYPEFARSRGIEGTAKMRLIIDVTGQLHDFRLIQSSGSQILDDEALELIKRALPLPVYPDASASTTYQFDLPLIFSLTSDPK